MIWTRTVDPTLLAVSLRDAKEHARITHPNEDATILRYIAAATDAAEQVLNRGLLTQTWQLGLECFSDEIWLPMAAPLQNDATPPSTQPVVQYYDSTGTLQTLAAATYVVDTLSRPGRILRASNQFWPALESGRLGSRVLITYVVGWTDPLDIPERIRQGIRLYVSWLDADRDGMDPNGGAARLAAESCWSDRVFVIEPNYYPMSYPWPV